MKRQERMYVEMHCTSCKRNHMISREAAVDQATVKKCPHCLSPKVGPTGMLGFTATNQEIKSAIALGTGIAKDIENDQVHEVIDEMRRHTDEHQKKQMAENLWTPERTDIIDDVKTAIRATDIKPGTVLNP